MSMNSFHARKPRPAPERPAGRAPVRHPPGTARADALLVERGLASSRALAKQLIETGRVSSATGPVIRAGQLLPVTAQLHVATAAAADDGH